MADERIFGDFEAFFEEERIKATPEDTTAIWPNFGQPHHDDSANSDFNVRTVDANTELDYEFPIWLNFGEPRFDSASSDFNNENTDLDDKTTVRPNLGEPCFDSASSDFNVRTVDENTDLENETTVRPNFGEPRFDNANFNVRTLDEPIEEEEDYGLGTINGPEENIDANVALGNAFLVADDIFKESNDEKAAAVEIKPDFYGEDYAIIAEELELI